MADFLQRTIVLTPQKLHLSMRKQRFADSSTIVVEPTFDAAPPRWLEIFDRFPSVLERYDIPDQDGVVQIMIEPAVRSVLQEIRRWPGRVVSGQRAEAFIRNPYASLGDDAVSVIDEQQFEAARDAAGIRFERFSIETSHLDNGRLHQVVLLVEPMSQYGSEISRNVFESPDSLERFLYHFESRFRAGFQCCLWEGYELEILGDAQEQIELIRGLLLEWRSPQPRITFEEVYDLSRYSGRIDGIGVEKEYASPYIARKSDEQGWIPENVTFGIMVTPDGAGEPINLQIGDAEKIELGRNIARAEQAGATIVEIPGLHQPVNLQMAKQVLQTLTSVHDLIKRGEFEPGTGNSEPARITLPKGPRKSLLLRANITDVDYLEARKTALSLPAGLQPCLPAALRPSVMLKDHQLVGVAWLQHLYSNAPDACRGALLADDMGLGKTLQLLVFIQSCLEKDQGLEPVLIVAPLTLLENWKEEVEKFFRPGTMPMVILYGDGLKAAKLSKSEIDPQLVKDGIVNFLRPGWLGRAKVVLTTYETLRDLEFSLAAQHWSIMVCDEAQKIKNPNALMTRAAKKQNVTFKVACTGTPVENSLADLWCLFDFIQPGLLGSLNEFGTRYRKPIEAASDGEKERVEELRSVIEPQTLRRMKSQIAQDLPQKIEVKAGRDLLLSAFQRQLYAKAVQNYKAASESGASKNHLALIHQFGQICTDPRPLGQRSDFQESLASYAQKSPKLPWLLETLEAIQKRKEKAIIFVEYLDLQRQLQRYISERFGFSPDIINGSTSAAAKEEGSRQKRIKAFQAKDGFGAIILSPLAVGYGVNIQAANHVIHYTRTWNPAKEDQATDRAYRIGAEKDVYVYYPIVTAEFVTFDMKLDSLLSWKRSLSEDMLNGCGELSAADFTDLGAPDGDTFISTEYLEQDDIRTMEGRPFECMIKIVFSKLGYTHVYQNPGTGDGGIDVVAIRDLEGVLIQCKTSMQSQSLGWDAVKEVVGGTAAYQQKHPGIRFRRLIATNSTFNSTAVAQARANDVEIYQLDKIADLLARHPIMRIELESHLISG